MKNAKLRMENAAEGAPAGGADGVINSPSAKVINRAGTAKKKSPFKNTLKKKNGKYSLGFLIKRGRVQARAYAGRCDGAIPEQAAAIEAVEAFGGTARDLHLWAGAAFALGLDDFLEVFRQQIAENAADGMPRDVRRAFQAKLCGRLAVLRGEEARHG